MEDDVAASMASIDPNLNVDTTFAASLHNKAAESNFKMSIGSVTAHISASDSDKLFLASVAGLKGDRLRGASPDHLSKIWRIDLPTACRTITVTSQLKKQDTSGAFSRNYSMNDCMLRYRRIHSCFFTDTFFVTKKARSIRGNACMQLFFSDKGFVYVVPMKSKANFPNSLKLFVKEIGVPEALIVDPSGEQTSTALKTFCHEIGTTLQILEEHTQHANLLKLMLILEYRM